MSGTQATLRRRSRGGRVGCDQPANVAGRRAPEGSGVGAGSAPGSFRDGSSRACASGGATPRRRVGRPATRRCARSRRGSPARTPGIGRSWWPPRRRWCGRAIRRPDATGGRSSRTAGAAARRRLRGGCVVPWIHCRRGAPVPGGLSWGDCGACGSWPSTPARGASASGVAARPRAGGQPLALRGCCTTPSPEPARRSSFCTPSRWTAGCGGAQRQGLASAGYRVLAPDLPGFGGSAP